MKTTKTLLSAGVLTAVAIGSLASVNAASAQGEMQAHQDELIDRIVQDTGADRTTVEASFEAHHEAMQAERQQHEAEHLQELVDEGKITASQRDAIIEKRKETHAAIEALKDQELNRDERHEQMHAIRQEFEDWAESQGIDLSLLRPQEEGNHEGHGGPHRTRD